MDLLPFGILLAFVFLGVWIHQFTFLMSLSDHQLPGRHDKLIWALFFFMIPILAPFIFIMWKKMVSAEFK